MCPRAVSKATRDGNGPSHVRRVQVADADQPKPKGRTFKEVQKHKTTLAKLPRKFFSKRGLECCQDFMNRNCECPKECKPDNGECQNRPISNKKLNPNMKVTAFENKGFGVVATADMKNGEFLGEYVGEVITEAEDAKRRSSEQDDYYSYTLSSKHGIVIDARWFGNKTRFINHSCKPNAITHVRRVVVNRNWMEERLYIETLRPIKKGEEITIDYQWENMTCYCNESNCRY